MPVTDLPETASQTAGPFVHIGTMPRLAGFTPFDTELGRAIAGPDCPGTRIVVKGRVLDGLGAPVRDMMIEVWQADPDGIHAHPEDPRRADLAPDFTGFGRVHTDFETGLFRIETVRPGAVPGRHGRLQAPHLSLWMVARGVNIGLSTRIYFGDGDNSDDPVLGMIDPATRRETLIAEADEGGTYRHDIHLQGPHETVFLDI